MHPTISINASCISYLRTVRNDPEVAIDQSGDEAIPRTGRGGRVDYRPLAVSEVKPQCISCSIVKDVDNDNQLLVLHDGGGGGDQTVSNTPLPFSMYT